MSDDEIAAGLNSVYLAAMLAACGIWLVWIVGASMYESYVRRKALKRLRDETY